jgi:hypothetical protein
MGHEFTGGPVKMDLFQFFDAACDKQLEIGAHGIFRHAC